MHRQTKPPPLVHERKPNTRSAGKALLAGLLLALLEVLLEGRSGGDGLTRVRVILGVGVAGVSHAAGAHVRVALVVLQALFNDGESQANTQADHRVCEPSIACMGEARRSHQEEVRKATMGIGVSSTFTRMLRNTLPVGSVACMRMPTPF